MKTESKVELAAWRPLGTRSPASKSYGLMESQEVAFHGTTRVRAPGFFYNLNKGGFQALGLGFIGSFPMNGKSKNG